MIPALLCSQLAEYSVVAAVDVGCLSHSPDLAYKFFNTHYQESYLPDQRLVLYTSHPISDQLLSHLYDATQLIDISNCFVVICTPHDTQDQINAIASSKNVNHFESVVCTIADSEPIVDQFVLPETVCPLPWMHIEISNNGNIQPCCVADSIGNINHSRISDQFMSAEMNNLRNSMLNGSKPTACNTCWNLESNGLHSNRLHHKSLLQKQLLLSSLSSPAITSIDIKPGNTCNFKCRICSPAASSLHAAEQSNYSNLPIVKSSNWAEESTTFGQLYELLPNLTNIDMYGGEPFLIKSLTRYVQHAVKSNFASDIRLHYNTNGSIFPAELIKYWPAFRRVDIDISIDNIGSKFEIERGGSWIDVEQNIRSLLALDLSNLKISIMPTVNVQNVLYIDELLDWAELHQLPVNINYLTNPKGFALTQLTKRAKEIILKKFEHNSHQELRKIVKFISTLPDSNGEEFKKITRYYDQIRNQSFQNTHPEIAIAMGYTV
jgi:radical SAM protein with 4Fe4S-binding SPASM domain